MSRNELVFLGMFFNNEKLTVFFSEIDNNLMRTLGRKKTLVFLRALIWNREKNIVAFNRWHNNSRVSAMLHELSWESLARRRERAMDVWFIKSCKALPWLQNKVLTPNPQCTRGSHSWKYAPILPHNNTFKFSDIPHSIIAWNALPPGPSSCWLYHTCQPYRFWL